jgi:hypothetical protein
MYNETGLEEEMKDKMKHKNSNILESEFEMINMALSLRGKDGDCHKTARVVAESLKSLGYKVEVVRGFYYNPPNKKIKHSWIEYEDKILETDCRQLREEGDIMPDKFCAVLDKSKFKHRYLLTKDLIVIGREYLKDLEGLLDKK